MEAYEYRLQSFTKARRVKKSTAKRAVSLKWPHPTHFIATPDTLTEAGFFFNPTWDARDNVECYFCGKCLDGWEEQDDPFTLHWNKCRDTCAWAVLRCGLNDDVDHKGNFTSKDTSRQPDGKPMEKARLATFRLNDSWPHDQVKGHGANSTKMAKAGFTFTPQIPGDDTGTCLYCRVSLSGWDEDDDPMQEHHKRVKKSNLTCPFFPEASGPKSRSRTTSLRSTTQPKSRAGSRQPRIVTTETSSHSDENSQPVPPRPAQRSRTTSLLSASKERDPSDVLRRSTRSSRAKPPPEVEEGASGTELSDVLRRSTRSSRAKPPPEVEDASGTELSKSTLGQSRSKSSGKGKGKGHIEVIEEADEGDITRAVLPTKQCVEGKENAAHDTKVPRPRRHTKALRADDTEEEAHPPKRRPPKKGKALLDEREESSPDVDSESEVQPVGKRRNRVIESVSSGEVITQETKPNCQAPKPMNKVKGKAPIDVPELVDDHIAETECQSHRIEMKFSEAPAQCQVQAIEGSNEGSDDEPRQVEQEQAEKSLPSEETTLLSGREPVRDMDDRALSPSARSSHSREWPEPRTIQRDERPATPPPHPPPPPSSSILSVSSTTSTTKVEGHTDTETLVESLPVRTNGAQLAEEERGMTVEQWIRLEIEVQYERLRRDGEEKIRLFKERAEEVRRQIEAL